MFIAALFTVAKTWKHPKVSIERCMNTKMCYIYTTRILFSHEKEGNPAICNNINKAWRHYIKWNMSGREGQLLYDLICMWNLKKNKIIETESVVWWLPGAGRWGKLVKVVEEYSVPVIRWIRSENVMYSMVTAVNNTVLYAWNLLRE